MAIFLYIILVLIPTTLTLIYITYRDLEKVFVDRVTGEKVTVVLITTLKHKDILDVGMFLVHFVDSKKVYHTMACKFFNNSYLPYSEWKKQKKEQ